MAWFAGRDSLLNKILNRNAGGAVGEQPHDLVNGQGTGYFAGGGAAHSIADQVDAVLEGVSESIFVGGSLAAPIGNRRSRIVNDSRGQMETPIAQCTRDSGKRWPAHPYS